MLYEWDLELAFTWSPDGSMLFKKSSTVSVGTNVISTSWVLISGCDAADVAAAAACLAFLDAITAFRASNSCRRCCSMSWRLGVTMDDTEESSDGDAALKGTPVSAELFGVSGRPEETRNESEGSRDRDAPGFAGRLRDPEKECDEEAEERLGRGVVGDDPKVTRRARGGGGEDTVLGGGLYGINPEMSRFLGSRRRNSLKT
jgi:hypothetical protein